jgi:hypothetical protein
MEEDKSKNNSPNEDNSTKLPNEAETGPTYLFKIRQKLNYNSI